MAEYVEIPCANAGCAKVTKFVKSEGIPTKIYCDDCCGTLSSAKRPVEYLPCDLLEWEDRLAEGRELAEERELESRFRFTVRGE